MAKHNINIIVQPYVRSNSGGMEFEAWEVGFSHSKCIGPTEIEAVDGVIKNHIARSLDMTIQTRMTMRVESLPSEGKWKFIGV